MTIELYKIFILLAFLAPAVWLDQKHNRIPNRLTGALLLAGVLYQTAAGGVPGTGDALAGMLVGFGIFLVPYLLGGMAAGDVKLMAAIGSCLGLDQALTAAFYALLVGGGIGMLVVSYRYYRDSNMSAGVLATARFPFASAMAIGTAAALVVKELPWTI